MVDAGKVDAVNEAINEIESKTMINYRIGNNFTQDKVISQYTNNILFLLYYVIFILFAVSLYLNRETYSTFLIVIILLIFGVLPFIIKYITRFAYYRFLDISHLFYIGNARYLGPKAMPQ
jgi:NhaP-type Na+/H+ or K+/H+ antiporter